jgi:hypothetical protein
MTNMEGFKALVTSDRSGAHQMEDVDGNYRYWDELSLAAKMRQIASNAAYCDVTFERFSEAVRDSIGSIPPEAREEAALWLALQSQRELHELEKLLPRYDRLEPAPPLLDRFQQLLDAYEAELAQERESSND